jgi:hypothetical protein
MKTITEPAKRATDLECGGNPDLSGATPLWIDPSKAPSPSDKSALRLRVTVASAAFPKYDRNLNTGGDNERDTRYVVVRQRILHDRAHPSFVRLPIIPR